MKKQSITKAHEGLHVTAAQLLVLSARVVANPPPEVNAGGIELSRMYVDGILAGAKGRGYSQTDALRLMLASGETSTRLVEMSRAACRAAGTATINRLIARMPA
jgi:hypothetical protein